VRKINPSWAALVVASIALFAGIGGPAWAEGLINGAQIQNRSITSRKIGRGQIKAVNLAGGAVRSGNLATGSVTNSSIADQAVSTSKLAPDAVTSAQLADGAVTGSKVAAGSLTAADVAPNTFLATNGTAVNSTQLGGVPASGFVQGTGNLLQRRIDVPVGTSGQFLLDVGLGEIDGSCLAGAKPEISFTAEAQPLDLIEWGTSAGTTQDINPVHGMLIGSTYTEPDPTALQAIDFQVAQGTNSVPSRVATIWTTGDAAGGGTECIFSAQAVTTGV
jgi:hypothetical protein